MARAWTIACHLTRTDWVVVAEMTEYLNTRPPVWALVTYPTVCWSSLLGCSFVCYPQFMPNTSQIRNMFKTELPNVYTAYLLFLAVWSSLSQYSSSTTWGHPFPLSVSSMPSSHCIFFYCPSFIWPLLSIPLWLESRFPITACLGDYLASNCQPSLLLSMLYTTPKLIFLKWSSVHVNPLSKMSIHCTEQKPSTLAPTEVTCTQLFQNTYLFWSTNSSTNTNWVSILYQALC